MNRSGAQSTETPVFLSIVVPAYNESEVLAQFMRELHSILEELPHTYEVLLVNDGSTDDTQSVAENLQKRYEALQIIEFSRNFGKERATTAGLHRARGTATICIDADLQHPPRLIPQFIAAWEDGHDVVIGVRNQTRSDSWIKNAGSHAIYKILNCISETPIIPRATDYRLVDRLVLDEFNRFSERNRITRGLIDWLGFRRTFVYFDVDERVAGVASYSIRALRQLAINSIVSMSSFPLKLASYLGVTISLGAMVLGGIMALDRFILATNYFAFSGTAILATFTLFLVGIVLTCMGFLALYIDTIHQETQGRPLYVVRRHRLGTAEPTKPTQTTERCPIPSPFSHSSDRVSLS